MERLSGRSLPGQAETRHPGRMQETQAHFSSRLDKEHALKKPQRKPTK